MKSDSTSKPQMGRGWTKGTEKTLCRTPVFEVVETPFTRDSDALTHPFCTLKAPDWVNILAFTEDGLAVAVRQYRFGTASMTLELPAGVVDEGEEPLQAAERELLEETGYAAGEWVSLGSCASNPALMDNRTHLFLALDCSPARHQEPDAHEEIEIELLTRDALLNRIRTQQIDHAIAMATITRWLLLEKRTDSGDPLPDPLPRPRPETPVETK